MLFVYPLVIHCLFFSVCIEFLEVGKKQPALDVLYDVIKSKKHRTWQKIHEPIMLKYLELCVDLRKSHLAKEGLYQYKNICQQVREERGLHGPGCCWQLTGFGVNICDACVVAFRSISSLWRMWLELTSSWRRIRPRQPRRSPSRWFWTSRTWTTFRLLKGDDVQVLNVDMSLFAGFFCIQKCPHICC